jgi:hypothetical protein
MFLVAPLPIVLACLPNVFLGVVLGLLLVVPYAFWSAFSGLRANHFGLCNGMNGEDRGDADALTERLHTLYNGLLKRSPEDDPVCFRDLWGAGAAAGDREINLQVITTALNLRRPYRVPNDPGVEPLREFLYDPAEWKELFPPAVMDWLAKDWKERNPQSPDGIQCKCPGVTLRSLPPASRLPILVAVRMSVAFPGLLSAVPMYTVERKRRPASRASAASAPSPSDDQAFIARRVYFADGGITSNCPVHLFDAPLPRHPTFVVSLDVLPDGAKDMGPRDRICLQGGDVERPDTVRRFESGGPLREALSFLWSIVDTSINWRDSLQRTVPGSEERVAIVKLKANEGSLNLHMDPPTIGAVADLGSHAADKFIEAFAGPRTNGQSNAWDRHRWIRMRSTIATARNYLHAIWIAETKNEAGYRRTLVSSKQLDPWFSNAGSVETAIALLEKLNALGFDPLSAAKSEPTEPGTDPASTWPDVSYNQPTPAPRLHMSPPW